MTKKFITFEGGDGSGKTTQIKMLSEYFRQNNIEHICTREPGGTKTADAIRSLLLSSQYDWQAKSELAMFIAARYEHLHNVILPAIKDDKIVICDRFIDSTIAYQGYGHNMDIELIKQAHKLMIGGISPDITFILDIDVREGLLRSQARLDDNNIDEGRFESMDISFHERLRTGFLQIAGEQPNRCKIIDASQDISQIHANIISLLS